MSQYRQQGSVAYLISIVLVAVIGGLLFGYDTAVISGAEKGLQAFFENAKDFAYTNAMHGFTTSSALIGCVIGALVSGRLAISFGRKRTLFIAGILFLLSALGSWYPEFLFFEKGVPTAGLLIAFNAYRVLGGLGVGLASAICPMYIAEIAPARKRGRLVSWNQFAIIFGQLVVYFVNFLIVRSHANDPAVMEWTTQIGWRTMFVSEAVPAGLFALLILLVPETPRYLAIHGQEEKALQVLSNINGEARAREILADIKATVRQDSVKKNEKIFTYGIMVIFIGCMLSVFQQIIGINAVLYFAPRIFASMGMDDPMFQTVLMGIINITFTLVAGLQSPKAHGGCGGRPGRGHEQCPDGPGHRSRGQHHGLQCLLHVQLGPHLLGVHLGDFPEHHPQPGHSHRRCLPVDFQLHRFLHLRAPVRHVTLLRICLVRWRLPGRSPLRLEAGARDQGQDARGDERLVEEPEVGIISAHRR